MSLTQLLFILVLAQCGCSLSSQVITKKQSSETASQKLPTALEAKGCEPATDNNELPKDRFARKGGREIQASVVMDDDVLTAADIAQGRDLTNYERLNFKNSNRSSFEPSSVMPQARSFSHDGLIHDLPTYYAVEWVRPAGWREPGLPLGAGEKPDPQKHQLEFRDICGEVEQSF